MASSSLSRASPKKRKHELATDAFDCPICAHSLTGKIYQCPRGHHLCEECLTGLKEDGRGKSCPTCRAKFPRRPEEIARSLALEALAATCSFDCRFGCNAKGCPAFLQPHLALCEKGPAQCPMHGLHGCERDTVPADELAQHLQTVHDLAKTQSGTIRSLSFENYEPGFFEPWLVLSPHGPVLWKLEFCTEDDETPSLFRANVRHFTGAPKRYVFKLHGPRGDWLARCSTSSFVRTEIEKDQIVFGKEAIEPLVHHEEEDVDFPLFFKFELSVEGVVEEEKSTNRREVGPSW